MSKLRGKVGMDFINCYGDVEDILWTDESYRAVYKEASLEAVQVFKPLAKGDEPDPWANETKIPPWVIYVLRRAMSEA